MSPVRFSFPCRLAAGMLGLLGVGTVPVSAQSTWNSATGGSWSTAANWTPATVPNGIGADVVFNGAATGANPAQSANHSVTLDGVRTAGSILFNNDLGAFNNSITTGTGGPLTFDATGTGPATITTAGTGTGNNTISVAMSLADSLTATVNNTSAASAAGSLSLTAAISGAGGFTKQGDGMATFGTGAKTYTGATVIAAGRMRMSQTASPTATSGLTVSAGGQLTLISAGSYTFGSAPVTLGGAGAVSGPSAAFPGAIRNDTGLVVTITNAVVLFVDTLLHIQGAAGALNLPGTVSGGGQLAVTAPGSSADLGTLSLGGANNYSGGTLVRGGMVTLSAAAATFGTGDVTVLSAGAMITGGSARLEIPTGTLDSIMDVATLSLAGGNVAGVADDGYVILGPGVNETVGGLILGGVFQAVGTYGSTASGALFQNDEYFSGPGRLTVVPEPAGLTLLALACGPLFRRRRGVSTRPA
ncbi:MAG: autotransporter-associated beta strand repeat-containing protein [Verrucomicrobiota bacterium]